MKHHVVYNKIKRRALKDIGLEPGMPNIHADLIRIGGGRWDVQILQPREEDKAQVAYGIIDKFLRENYLESSN